MSALRERGIKGWNADGISRGIMRPGVRVHGAFPDSEAELKVLHDRNVGRMAPMGMHTVPIRALWWGGFKVLERWRIIPNPYYSSWRLYWNDRPGARVVFEQEEYPLPPDRVLAVPPKTPITARLDSPVGHLNVNFLLGHPYDNVRPQVLTAGLAGSLQEAARELAGVAPNTGLLTVRQTIDFQLLLGLLLREVRTDDLAPQPTDDRVRRVLEMLDESPDLSNAEMAEIAGMSRNGFHRLFRQQIGVPPHAYVFGKKMDLACGLLQHTGDTVDMIAEACGFNDRAYFAKAFRRQFRMSPSEYRRTHGEIRG